MQGCDLTGILNSCIDTNVDSEEKEKTFDITRLNGNMKKISTTLIELKTKQSQMKEQGKTNLLDQLPLVHV